MTGHGVHVPVPGNQPTRRAILGTAYEFATGQRLASGDFEGERGGAIDVLGKLHHVCRVILVG
jgi:hypothetical protein